MKNFCCDFNTAKSPVRILFMLLLQRPKLSELVCPLADINLSGSLKAGFKLCQEKLHGI